MFLLLKNKKEKIKKKRELNIDLKILVIKENKRKEIIKMKGAINIFETIKNQNNVNKNLAHSRLIKQTNLRQIQKNFF